MQFVPSVKALIRRQASRAFLLFVTCLLCGGFLVAAAQEPQKQEPAKTAPEKESIRFTLVFVGDVLMEAEWRQPSPPPNELFTDVKDILSGAGLAICNLESPLTEWTHQTRFKNKTLVAAGRDYILRVTSPAAAPALREAGFRIAALANNHTMDYGERGILETMERLRDAGVLSVGAGATRGEAEKAQIVEVQGLRVGVLSFSDVVPPGFQAQEDWPGIASAKDVSRVQAAIKRARPDTDFLAIVFHWGVELERMPTKRQMQLARLARDAGADLVLGSHPHVLQPVGCVGITPVVYSAGNFIFPAGRPLAQRSSIFEVEVVQEAGEQRAKATSVRIIPTVMNEEGRARLADADISADILREMKVGAARLGAKMEDSVVACTGKPIQYVPSSSTHGKKPSSKKRH